MRHVAPSQMGAKPAHERPDANATRLRVLYFIAAVLAALVPLVAFAGLWLRSEFDKSQREIDTFLATRANAVSQWLDAEVRQETTALQAIAALPSLDEANLPEFHLAATRMIAPVPQWAFLGLVDPSGGRQVLNTLRPLGSDLPGMASAETIRRVSTTRRPAVQTHGAETDQVYAGRVVLLCVPVIRNDSVRFVLVAGIKTEVLQKLLEQTAEPDLLTLVLDERDQVLARSRNGEHFGNPAGERGMRPNPEHAAGLFAMNTPDGRQLTTAFRRSSLTGWTALAASDRKPFDEMSARSTWATVWAGALSLLLAAVLAVFLFYNVIERRISDERLAASRALSELDARLLTATQESLTEQRKAASERDVLLREIYHRVKNNLQIVQSLLRLGSRDLRPDQREPFESAIRRIGAMARVHTLLYNSPDLASIDFKDYLEGLLKEAAEAFGAEERGIQTILQAESMRVPLDTAVPLAFVTVEILTNALKHAFPEGRPGTVTVTASQEDNHGVLTIADNGVGLPAETASKRSLGLTIIGKLVDQIGGSVDKPPAGESTFRIRFPIRSAANGANPKARPNP
jgi:two-component sensor histidine kinase